MAGSRPDRAARPPGIAGLLPKRRTANPSLPPLWAGRRRRHLTLLILAGLGQAAAAGVGASYFTHALTRSGTGTRGVLFGVLIAAAVVVGLLCMAERVLSERLSLDYSHEIRMGIITRSLLEGRVKSMGGAAAPTINDLTSVKNWISHAVAPLAAGIPLIVGVAIALALIDPALLLGLLVPIILLFLAMRTLAPAAYQWARRVRRMRGRLSSQVADTLLSSAAIRSAGRSDRELGRIEKYSQVVVAESIEKAKVAGAMRGTAAAMSGIATAMVIGTGLLVGLPTQSIAGALTIVGVLAAPMYDLGRVVEYRQTYRVARRIGPSIGNVKVSAPKRAELIAVPSTQVGGTVVAAFLELSDGTMMPQLAVQPGARVVLDAGNEQRTSEVLERIVGLREGYAGAIVVGGRDLSVAGPKDLRRLVGYAAQGMMLVRGTVSWTVRHRVPEAGPEEVDRLLAEVDLADRLAELAQGADTLLVHGGEPLTISERARLLLARAILDDPPLLVFDHLDADLGLEGRSTMRRLLEDYPGVVILASDEPDQVIKPTHVWRPEGVARIAPTPTVSRRRRSAS